MKNIAVVCGGNSAEYVVSIKSGQNIFDHIDTNKFRPWMIRIKGEEWVVLKDNAIIAEMDKHNFSFLLNAMEIKLDYALILIHGSPGEDGLLQGYFDILKVPYSGCGVYTSALTFNKFCCNNFLRSCDIKMADSIYLKRGEAYSIEEISKRFGYPLFIKPSASGSSLGVTKVREPEQIDAAIEDAWNESDDCLIEEFIDGMELAVGVCDRNGNIQSFLPTEVIPKGDFFDFVSKYTAGGATEITPARLPQDKIDECQKIAEDIYKLTACHGIVRVDFILKNDIFYFLEINTVPGMTDRSFIPQQLEAMGLHLMDVVSDLIQENLQINKMGRV